MLTYSKDEIASQLAWELMQQGTRGLTSVAVCLPELTIAGGFYHLWDNPLLVIPHLFLLNEETKQVADPFVLIARRSPPIMLLAPWAMGSGQAAKISLIYSGCCGTSVTWRKS